ncbi:MAG: hypothetical protein WAW96_05220, partial [Alphaproteobacteria bacterium]
MSYSDGEGEEPEGGPEGDLRADRREPLHERVLQHVNRFWWLRVAAIAFGAIAFVGIALGLAAAIYVARLSANLPDYKALENYRPPITTRVHAGDGTLIAEFATENRLFV